MLAATAPEIGSLDSELCHLHVLLWLCVTAHISTVLYVEAYIYSTLESILPEFRDEVKGISPMEIWSMISGYNLRSIS